MTRTLTDQRPLTACHPFCAGAAAGYASLLAAHDRPGRPLLTADGVTFVRQLLLAAGPDISVPGPFDPAVPHWDTAARRLWLGSQQLKLFRQLAPHQTALLAAFEDRGWPARVADPIPAEPGDGPEDGRHRLHETVRNLNRGLPPWTLRFRGDGTGAGVRWQFCRPPVGRAPESADPFASYPNATPCGWDTVAPIIPPASAG